jgi:D-xylose transport system ATP-binding protein
MSEDDIITMMVGRELTALYPNEPHTTAMKCCAWKT